MWEFLRLAKDVKKRFSEIKHPALVFHPREDDQSGISNAFYLAKNLGGPVEMTVLDDCYHMVTLDRQRSVVVDRTVDFVQRLTDRLEEQAAVQNLVKGKGLAE